MRRAFARFWNGLPDLSFAICSKDPLPPKGIKIAAEKEVHFLF